MAPEGGLLIDLSRSPDGLGDARITSHRALGLARAFVGKRVDDAVKTVPLLFNICGMAQGSAVAEAAEHALGEQAIGKVAPGERAFDAMRRVNARRVRHLLVQAEIAREHMISMVRDTAHHLDTEASETATLRILKCYKALASAIDPRRDAFTIGASLSPDQGALEAAADALATTIEDLVLAEPILRFEARQSEASFMAWLRAGRSHAQCLASLIVERGWSPEGDVATDFLPSLAETELARSLAGDAADLFARQPTWLGAPKETGPLSRQHDAPLVQALTAAYGRGLLTRFAARLVELARLPARLRATAGTSELSIRAASPALGHGIAQVEASRGRLIHSIEVVGDLVKSYAIVAPTEWNFHPAGSGRRSLARIAARPRDVEEVAGLFVASLDPCVAYDVRVR
ncbi:MAG: nickel-dependent hydrogenase large subunit [Hyphomicrobium sp.]|jgi:coenzyme F420-reducing hydrogenase alpha subunit